MKKHLVSAAVIMLALMIIPASAEAKKPEKNNNGKSKSNSSFYSETKTDEASLDVLDGTEEVIEAEELTSEVEISGKGNDKKNEKKALKEAFKTERKEEKAVLKAARKALYSEEEWSQGLKLQSEINEDPELRALSLDSVIILDKPVKFDTPPVIKSGRTLIPVRGVAASLGADVAWNAETNTVTITKGDNVIEFVINDDMMKINGQSKKLDVPAQIVNRRTVVPLRALIESMNLGVEWDKDTETVVISEEPVTEEPAVDEPAAEEPIVEEPVVDEPAVEETVVEEPVVEEPIAEEVVVS